MPKIYKYRLTNTALEVVIFGNTIRWQALFDQIESIESRPLWEMFIVPAGNLQNQIFTRNCVFVQRRAGFPKRICITPNQPIEFVAEVKKRIEISNLPFGDEQKVATQ